MNPDEKVCLNCSTPLTGKFCSDCGQKQIEPNERTLKHFVYQFLGSAFFLENNFAKNLWYLVVHPGKLPLDFIEGRRKRWMPPFSLFLLINLFYFWFSPLTDLNLGLHEQVNQPHHISWAGKLVNNKLEREGVTFEEYADRYAEKSTGYSNSLIILHIPIFAFFLSLIYFRKRYFFVDHFIYALYFLAFILFVGLVQTGMIYMLIGWLGFGREVFTWTGITLALVVLTYTFASLRKTYYQTTGWAAAAVLPVFVVFVLTHFMYRTILFLIIFSVT